MLTLMRTLMRILMRIFVVCRVAVTVDEVAVTLDEVAVGDRLGRLWRFEIRASRCASQGHLRPGRIELGHLLAIWVCGDTCGGLSIHEYLNSSIHTHDYSTLRTIHIHDY